MNLPFTNENWDKIADELACNIAQCRIFGGLPYNDNVAAPTHAILSVYAKRHGGIDKKDMLLVADMLKFGDKLSAVEYAAQLDTDPRDFLIGAIVKD